MASSKRKTPVKKNGATKKNGANGKSGTLPATKKMATRLNLNVERLRAVHVRVDKWKKQHDIDKAAALVASSMKKLEEASKILSAVPDDFRPWKIGTPQVKAFAVGDVVRITDKRKQEYDGMIEEDEMKDLKVLEERGKSVLVETSIDGMKMLIRRAHLMSQEAEAN